MRLCALLSHSCTTINIKIKIMTNPSIHPSTNSIIHSQLSHPGQALLERLEIGFTEPDQELYTRAHSFASWAPENPVIAAHYLGKMRQRGFATAHLWEAIKGIVEPVSPQLAAAVKI